MLTSQDTVTRILAIAVFDHYDELPETFLPASTVKQQKGLPN